MNSKNKRINILKMFILFALVMTFSGCRALSDALAPEPNTSSQELPSVQREKPNLTDDQAKIDVDPDSDDLVEDKGAKPNFNTDESKVESPKNNNTLLENPNSENEENENTTANTESNKFNSNENYVVTFNSFGKVKVGMTVAEGSRAIGTELVRGTGYEDACYYVEPKGLQGVSFMVTNGKIARIDISNNKYATDKGAKIGDTEDKIKTLYGRVTVNPQKYDEQNHDVEIYSSDEKYLIIFQTDGKNVTGFRVGNAEEVSFVEGCS